MFERVQVSEATLAEDMWTTASINMPVGARAGADEQRAATAVLNAIQQYTPRVGAAKKKGCNKKK